MADSQLLKGILEACVLGIVAKGETYGYEILAQLEKHGFSSVGEGTLYPVLSRLDKNGYIQCRKAKSPLGPIRKYYQITPLGIEKLTDFKNEFILITEQTKAILFKEGPTDEFPFNS